MDRAFSYRVPDHLEVGVGSLVRVPFGHRRLRGVVVGLERRLPERPLETIASVVVETPLCPPPLDRLAAWMAERYCTPRGVVLSRLVPPRVRVEIGPPSGIVGGPPPGRILAYEGGAELVAAIEGGAAQAWSLQTLAGEDRGELVGELVGAAGRAGGAALVAVPEVRFGAPTLEGVARHWPGLARVDTSRPPGKRAAEWLRLARGHGLGGGGRAALLAPSPALRLIVVDEEHSPGFKEDRTPRYHGRRVALERARLQGAMCVLASLTPSLEATWLARRGLVRAAVPARAAARAARPLVEVLPRPRGHPLGEGLRRRVLATLREGGRVALLVPTRGYARTLWCGSCHRSLRCPRCETGLAFHRSVDGEDAARVRCPRCELSAAPPRECPRCGGRAWRYLGVGSERLFEQVRRAWPRARVARMDPDVAEDSFERARTPDVYVTTWIGTKEALRPDVSLVGVLDADALLRRPEWWATEAAYQALLAMAEWAGPATAGGRLVVQCREPTHHAVQAVVRADHGFFAARELASREELGYPPFAELVVAAASGARAAEVLARVARSCRAAGATVLGPVPSRGRRPGGLELLAKCPDAASVAGELRGILGEMPSGTRLSIDVDPR